VREEEMRCQYFKDEKKKREKKCKLSLARARTHSTFEHSFLKSHFQRKKKRASLSLSLSLFSFQGKTREKKISRRRIFSLFLRTEKIKKNKHPPQKREKKFSPSSSNTVCFSLLVLVFGDQKMFLFRR
jgi:hypothetical protein